MSRHKSGQLCDLIQDDQTLIVPDAYDPLSAQLIERTGFKAVQISGYSMALAWGLTEESDLPLEWNLAVSARIAQSVSVPVMADGEDGYGEAEIAAETARAFLKAGLAGMNMEDQALHQTTGPGPLVDVSAMKEKIAAVLQITAAEGNPDFILNARSDALARSENRHKGLEDAIERANAYLAEGADMAFITGVKTMEEAKTIANEIEGPLSIAAGLPYNRDSMPLDQLCELGIARISLPVLSLFAAGQAMKEALGSLLETGEISSVVAEFNPAAD